MRERVLFLGAVILVVMAVVVLQCSDEFLNIDYQNPCFEKDIVPLVKRDCARCHENGEYRFKVTGSKSDYETLYSYSDSNKPEDSLIFVYATGKKKHPKIWDENSREYLAMYNWIANGAKESCIDSNLGECQSDGDCAEIACLCPDLSVVTVSKCYIDDNGAGICANDNNCTEPVFGICPNISEDAGTDDISDTSYVVDTGSDSGIKDTEYDSGIKDTGYDSGIKDTGYDAGFDASYDSGIKDTGYDTGYDMGYDAGVDTGGGSTVSFSKQIVPLIKADCRSCHYAGQHGVMLTGTTSDYSEVMRYVDKNNPEGAYGFLWWAAGGNGHPNKWPKGGTKYNLFLKWVQEGAQNN